MGKEGGVGEARDGVAGVAGVGDMGNSWLSSAFSAPTALSDDVHSSEMVRAIKQKLPIISWQAMSLEKLLHTQDSLNKL